MIKSSVFIMGSALLLSVVPIGCNDQSLHHDRADDPVALSTRNHLMWKRHHAIEHDLSRALLLPPGELCTELGQFQCVGDVHLNSLGGHDPFIQGLFKPLTQPIVTTSLALDRVVLSACGARVQRDRIAPEVFTALDLDDPAPDRQSDAFSHTVQTLYQRILGRDPIEPEYTALAELLVDDENQPVSGAQFAHLACLSVATTTEFLFF